MESEYQTFRDAVNLLVPDRLADFDASLADLPDAEKKRRRIQYLDNAMEPIGPGKPFMESLELFVKGMALYLSTAAKILLYSVLALAVVAWMVTGDFVDWWDAFLWLVAFVFIELNVFEWRQESHEEETAA